MIKLKSTPTIIPRPWSMIIISLAILLSVGFLTSVFIDSLNGREMLVAIGESTAYTIRQSGIPSVSSDEITPDDILEFSEEELEYLDGINLEPEVKYLRTAINRYLANGDRDELEIATNEIENCGLDKFKEYLGGKFVAYQMSPGKYGGQMVGIIFRDKPDKIFEAWVYQLADGKGSYDLRGFCTKALGNNEIGVVVKAFGILLRNDKVAL